MHYPDFHRLPAATDFYFLRHGESDSNRQGKIQGRSNSSLTDTGRFQATQAGKWFADRKIDRLYTSPLDRATESTACVTSVAALPTPVVLDELIELDTGILSGRGTRDLKAEDPELFARFLVESWEAIPGAESISSLQERTIAVWNRLIDDALAGAGSTLCITHGGTLQWLIKTTVGSSSWMPVFPASNCGIFHFRAESTSLDYEHPVSPPGGYFGTWETMNLVTYDAASREDPVSSNQKGYPS